VPSPNPGGNDETDIFGIRAVSATDIWAVGTYLTTDSPYRTLILHWDGTSWTKVPSPSPAGTGSGDVNQLFAVTASSATSAWAVGDYGARGSVTKTLALHWNGTSWRRVASPNPGSAANMLGGVAASSASAWAAGTYKSGGAAKTLILHWNGTAWKHVASPSPGGGGRLDGAGASSPASIWTVGIGGAEGRQAIALHCCR
jgi:hypothetical protein